MPQLQRQPIVSPQRPPLSDPRQRDNKRKKEAPAADFSLKRLGGWLVGLALAGALALGVYSQVAPAVSPSTVPAGQSVSAPSFQPLDQQLPAPDTLSLPEPAVQSNPLPNSQPAPQVNPGPNANTLPQPSSGLQIQPSTGSGGPPAFNPPVNPAGQPVGPGKYVPLTAEDVDAKELALVIPCQHTFVEDRLVVQLKDLAKKQVSGKIKILNPLGVNSLQVVDFEELAGLVSSEAGAYLFRNNSLDKGFFGGVDPKTVCPECGPADMAKLLWGPYTYDAWVALTPAQQQMSLVPDGKVPLSLAAAEFTGLALPVKTAEQGFYDREKLYPANETVAGLSIGEMLGQGYIWLELPVATMGFEAKDLKYWPQGFRIVFPSTLTAKVDYYTPLYQRSEGFVWEGLPLPSTQTVPQGRVNVVVDEPTWQYRTKVQDPLIFKVTFTSPNGDSQTVEFLVWAKINGEK